MRILPALIFTSCFLISLPAISRAQTNPGLTFTWGNGPSGKQQLNYLLDYGTPGFPGDRYRLKLGSQKVAISGVTISYPDYYTGTFDPKAIEIRVGAVSKFFGNKLGKSFPLSKVDIDQENHLIQLVPKEVIPAGTPVEVVLSNVKNPDSGGMYYFNCRIASPGDVPLMRYIGTWILSIDRP
jgi:hypothetical protein